MTLFIVGLLTLTAIERMGGEHDSQSADEQNKNLKLGCAIMFTLYSILTFIAMIFIHNVVPETKGKSPEDILGDERTKVLAMNQNPDDKFDIRYDEPPPTKPTKKLRAYSTNMDTGTLSPLNVPLIAADTEKSIEFQNKL